MGQTFHYECKDCGFQTDYASGVSGLRPVEYTPYICSKTKEIVVVDWVNPSAGLGFLVAEPQKTENIELAKKNRPVHPQCPACRDHNLDDEWLGGICPKCGQCGASIETDYWD